MLGKIRLQFRKVVSISFCAQFSDIVLFYIVNTCTTACESPQFRYISVAHFRGAEPF